MIDNQPKENTYSTKEASEIIGIKERAIQTRCKLDNVRKKNNKYLITDSLIALWKQKEDEANANANAKNAKVNANATQTQKTNATQLDLELESLRIENTELKKQLTKDIPHQEKLQKAIELITLEAMRQNITHKVFTDSEYQDLIGTISSVDFHIKQVEYLKSRVEKQDAILKELVNQTTQRNFLIAKEKGYDKD